eukprot:67732_1
MLISFCARILPKMCCVLSSGILPSIKGKLKNITALWLHTCREKDLIAIATKCQNLRILMISERKIFRRFNLSIIFEHCSEKLEYLALARIPVYGVSLQKLRCEFCASKI